MAIVDLTIGGRLVQLACTDGEEAHLLTLAESVNKRMKELEAVYEGSNDKLILVMTALMMQDEINELHKKPLDIQADKGNSDINSQSLNIFNGKINMISEYVDDLARRLEKC